MSSVPRGHDKHWHLVVPLFQFNPGGPTMISAIAGIATALVLATSTPTTAETTQHNYEDTPAAFPAVAQSSTLDLVATTPVRISAHIRGMVREAWFLPPKSTRSNARTPHDVRPYISVGSRRVLAPPG